MEISNVDSSEATQKSDIPAKRTKENYHICLELLYENFNNILETGSFLECEFDTFPVSFRQNR